MRARVVQDCARCVNRRVFPLTVGSLDPVGGEVVDSSERWGVVVARSVFTHRVNQSGRIRNRDRYRDRISSQLLYSAVNRPSGCLYPRLEPWISGREPIPIPIPIAIAIGSPFWCCAKEMGDTG